MRPMRSPARRVRAVLVLLVALVATLAAAGAGTPAQAAGDKGIVNGGITCPPKHSKCPGLKLLWFDRNWTYLGQRKLGTGAHGYSLTLPAGTYHLQFVDQRPAYDVTKYAPTDTQVTVRPNDLTVRNVTMQAGAVITGTARNGHGRPLGGATIVAASKGQQSFSTQANGKGQFAIGGLPQGQYSVFTFDRSKTWVGKSSWAGAVKPGSPKNMTITLTKRAGQMTVYLFSPKGLLKQKTTLTVTSKQTGQWWSATSGNGTFVFKGLYAGGYNAEFKGAGPWLAKTGAVQKADVKPNGFTSGKFNVTRHGAWVEGNVVDASQTGRTLQGARVQVWSSTGSELGDATTDQNGYFQVTGLIYTQSDVTIIVQPGPDSDYLGTEPNRCQYVRTEHADFDVTENEHSFVGDLGIDRLSPQTKPGCEA